MARRLLVLSLAAALLLPITAAQAPSEGTVAGAPSAPEWLDGGVQALFDGVTTASLTGDFAVHKATIQGTPRTAQELRQSYAGAAVFGGQDVFLAGVEAALKARLESTLTGVFPQAQMRLDTVTIDRSSLAAQPGVDAHHPPVLLALTGGLVLDLDAPGFKVGGESVGEDAVRTALELGAVARLPYDLMAPPGWNVTFAFTLPEWVRLDAAEGGALSDDERTAAWGLDNWRGTTALRLPAALVVAGRDAPAQDAPSDAKVALVIDLAKVEGLTIPGLLRGDFGSLVVHFDARVLVGALRLEDFPALQQQVRARLPSGLSIEGLNADGFRLAVQRGLLPPDALDEVEAYLQGLAASRTAALVPGGVALEGGFDEGALDASHISQPPDAEPPLAYHVQATFRIPLAPSGPSRMQAAAGPVLFQRELTFAVPRVEGLDTTYRIALPQGLAITDVAAEGARVERSTEGGRDVVTLTPTTDDASATFTVAVTADFVLAQFWYLWLGLGLMMALVVAGLLLWRRRRRAKPQASEPPVERAPQVVAAAATAPHPDAPPTTGAQP